MVQVITSKSELLYLVDEFIYEIEFHPGYQSIIDIMDNPMIQLLSELTGYQPGYFAKPMNNGEYVVFDLDKVRAVRNSIM